MSIIEDGTGKGNKVKVDTDNRFHVQAVNTPVNLNTAIIGRLFSNHTPVISLTSSSTSAVWYIRNNGSVDLIVFEIIISLGLSQELTGVPNPITTAQVQLLRNPLTPDFSGSMNTRNANFGSNITLDISTFSGSEGSAFADDGTVFFHDLVQHGTRAEMPLALIVLTPGSTIGAKIIPPSGTSTGNDAMSAHVAAQMGIKNNI